MVVARLCSASTVRLEPMLAGRGERRWLGTTAAEAVVARWEPMGAREYYDYRRAIYGDITHKVILVDATGTLITPIEPMAQVGSLSSPIAVGEGPYSHAIVIPRVVGRH